jgi:uncharacterized protein YueI
MCTKAADASLQKHRNAQAQQQSEIVKLSRQNAAKALFIQLDMPPRVQYLFFACFARETKRQLHVLSHQCVHTPLFSNSFVLFLIGNSLATLQQASKDI